MYSIKVFFNILAKGYIRQKSRDKLLYKQIYFTIGDFQGFIYGLVGRIWQQLVEELILSGKTILLVILQDDLYDDLMQNALGQSFICDLYTQWLVQGKEWLIQRVQRKPILRQRFIQPDRQGFRIYIINYFFCMVGQFYERLAIAIYISASQPSQGPKLISIQYRNSKRKYYNIFIEDQIVVFVSQYYKGFYIYNNTKVIFRYLLQELGKLVIQYLQLVLLFIEQIQLYQRYFCRVPLAIVYWAKYIWLPNPNRETEQTRQQLQEVLK